MLNGHTLTAQNDHHVQRLVRPQLRRICDEVPEPVVGARGWFVEGNGYFLLAEGPGVMRAVACPHTGMGYMTVYDSLEYDADARRMFAMHPIVLGQYMLDMGFNKGLVLEIGASVRPSMTITWMMAKLPKQAPQAPVVALAAPVVPAKGWTSKALK